MKKFTRVLLGLALLMASTQVFAGTRSQELGKEFLLNQASPQALADTQLGTKVIKELVQIKKLVWDFSVTSGSVGSTTLRSVDGVNAVLPKGAVITGCMVDEITTPVSTGSATFAFSTGLTSIGDLKAATAYGTFTGLVACIPVGTAGTAIRTTIDATPTVAIAGAPVTAGKLIVWLSYFLSDLRN